MPRFAVEHASFPASALRWDRSHCLLGCHRFNNAKPCRQVLRVPPDEKLGTLPSMQNGVTAAERTAGGIAFPWPCAEKPMMFYCQLGAEEMSASGTSFLNRTGAPVCCLVWRSIVSLV